MIVAGSAGDGWWMMAATHGALKKRLSAHAAQEEEEKLAREHSSPRAIIIHEIIREDGEQELTRTISALMLSGLAAGLSMGFSFLTQALLAAGIGRLSGGDWHLMTCLGYSMGFVFVVLWTAAAFHRKHADGGPAALHAARPQDVLSHGAAVVHRAAGQLGGHVALRRAADGAGDFPARCDRGTARHRRGHAASSVLDHVPARGAGGLADRVDGVDPAQHPLRAAVIEARETGPD
jgi:hypothetical protein